MTYAWIDGFFFVTAYSNLPLYIVIKSHPFVVPYFVLETALESILRYFLWNSLALLFFLWIHFTGLRERYMFWHLEKRRKNSGLIPIEIALATLYHSFYLCIGTEVLLCIMDASFLQYYSHSWIIISRNRFADIFFTSLVMNICLEGSGWNDFLRIGYYQR